MRRKSLVLLFMFFCLSNLAGQEIYTLQQCIDRALENNRMIKSQSLVKQEREIAYRQAKHDLLPNLNAGVGQDFTFGRSIGADNTYQRVNSTQTSFNISSNLTIFDGLKMKYNIDARKAEMYVSDAELEKIKADMILSVNMAFLEVLMNKELLQIAAQQLEITRKNVERQEILVKSEKSTKGDLYELLAQESKENLRYVEAGNNLKMSLLNLAQIIELDDFQQFDVAVSEDLERELELLPIETVYEQALKNRPEIKSAEYKLESSKKNVSIARSDYFPVLSLGVNFGTSYYKLKNVQNNSFGKQLSDNISTNIGLSLRIPIFNKLSEASRIKMAKIEVENSQLNIDNTKIELYKAIQQAHLDANAAKSRWDAAAKSETSAQEAYRFALQKYESGRSSQYDLFQAKSFLTQVLAEKTQAKYEYYFRLKILEMYNQ